MSVPCDGQVAFPPPFLFFSFSYGRLTLWFPKDLDTPSTGAFNAAPIIQPFSFVFIFPLFSKYFPLLLA